MDEFELEILRGIRRETVRDDDGRTESVIVCHHNYNPEYLPAPSDKRLLFDPFKHLCSECKYVVRKYTFQNLKINEKVQSLLKDPSQYVFVKSHEWLEVTEEQWVALEQRQHNFKVVRVFYTNV